MKKIPKIIIIFLILLCILIPNCFANTTNEQFTIYDTKNITVIMPSDYGTEDFTYYLMIKNSVYYKLYVSNAPFLVDNNYFCITNGAICYKVKGSNGYELDSRTTGETLDLSDSSIFNNKHSTSSTRIIESPLSSSTYLASNHTIYNKSTNEPTYEVIPEIVNPSFITLDEDLKTGNFNNIEISPNDYIEPFYLHVAEISRPIVEDTSIIYYTNQKAFYLGTDVSYYMPTGNLYSVPKSELGFAIETGKEYIFAISSNSSSIPNISEEEIFQKVEVIAEERSENAILNDKMDIQNETSKGMWETLKDILSYINPFSENFFVYKLIEMLVEALKSLFIPQDGFLGTYFEELKNWFSDRLGFLFYPFELLIDILDKILDINFGEPVFNIPDIHEPFTNKKLISATTFDFNSLLENNVLKTIHDIYLICLDAFIVFELVNLFRRKYEEVTTK